MLRCPTANGGGRVEDSLADLTHTEGDLASFERLDVTPGLKLVLRRFCHGLKALARSDTRAELCVISAERVTGGGFHARELGSNLYLPTARWATHGVDGVTRAARSRARSRPRLPNCAARALPAAVRPIAVSSGGRTVALMTN